MNKFIITVAIALTMGMAATPVYAEEVCVPQEYAPSWTEVVEPEVLEYEFLNENSGKYRWEAEDWNGNSHTTSWVKTGETRVKVPAVVIEHEAVEEVVCEEPTEPDPTCETDETLCEVTPPEEPVIEEVVEELQEVARENAVVISAPQTGIR